MAGSGFRFSWPNTFSVSAAGVPRVGAQLFFYATGTNTPQNTYADSALTVANLNPLIADADGQFGNIFLLPSPNYRVVLEDSAGNTIWDMDPIGPSVSIGGGTPAGMIAPYGGSTEPSGWLFCYGQAISRTTYATLFAAINTAFGIGDGATTFNVPDARGRALFGRDDMGGVAANRLTNAISGVTGVTLGASGGDQRTQVHGHGLTDPGHDHTDSGHTHPTDGVKFPVPSGPLAASGSFSFNLPSASVSSGNADIQNNTTGITIANYGAGGSQNVPPALVVNWIIFLG
jgi:microcystin-dependent protein